MEGIPGLSWEKVFRLITNIEGLQQAITPYSVEDQKKILTAAECSRKLHDGQRRDSGEPYFVHPLQVSQVLIEMNMDADVISAALLHDVLEDTRMNRVDLRREFGKEVESLVNGVTKISVVKAKNKSVQESDTIRKMLLAMIKDIRVILIKLADKLHNMRTLEFKPPQRRREIAQETLDIYAPLAGRLGISWLKDELEDLALKHINPNAYRTIKEYVAEKKVERAAYLQRVKDAIYAAAAEEKLGIEVSSRAKHFYSVYQKMKRYGKELDEIYDLLGLRLIVETTNQCYQALGLVHHLWPPIEGRFKDYIAMPKANQYQSLHTTVLCFGGKIIEIQIRTREMNNTAEFGIAAHWLYKQRTRAAAVLSDELNFIHKVRDLNDARITSSEFLEDIKREILRDSIYVFTPKGDAVQLPKGSTAIDFAYHIHSEVGNHTSGAKADGNIIPLREPLTNTQVIEILTNPNAKPHVNWLRYARTSRARSKIRNWLNKHDENLIINQNIIARKQSETERPHDRPQQGAGKTVSSETSQILDQHKVAVRVGDERNMMIRFARCCNPHTGDEIVGYVSRGRGIIIHRQDCRNLQSIDGVSERLIEVEWETVSPKITRRLRVIARHTNDLFSEIEGAIRKFHGHLIEGRVEEETGGNLEAMFTVEIERRQDLRKVIKCIRAVPTVMSLKELTDY